MNKSTSLYLDFLRVVAAFGVLIVHTQVSGFSDLFISVPVSGINLVMIFFVLSGYLISFTVDKKNKGLQQYLIDRLSRLYSVILPALILTFILDFIGSHYNPVYYQDKMAPDHEIFRYLMNFTFLSQIWGFCTKPSSNLSYWSLSYEFWYYMIFGVWIYFKGIGKILALIFICVLVGVKILLLFPVWIFGALAYKYSNNPKIKINKFTAILLFWSTLVSVLFFTFVWHFSFFSKTFVYGYRPLFFSSDFIFGWVFGGLVAINFWSFSFISCVKTPIFFDKIIKKASSFTFSLYLYHFPMLVFFGAIIPYNRNSYFQVLAILFGLVVITAVFSELTEKRRNYLRVFIERIFLFFSKKRVVNKLNS
jgi:peptidoglycan/LPS O-acetylase OafA/YrhL